MVSYMNERYFYPRQAFSKHFFFSKWGWKFAYFIDKLAKSIRNAVGKEHLIVFILKFVLKLKAIVA